jgi:hypothetical protein
MSYAQIAHGVRVSLEGRANKLFLIQARPVRNDWLREQIEALPTISRLAGEGRIKPHTYSELRFEAKYRVDEFGDVFGRTQICEVPPAVERSAFFVLDLATYAQGQSFREFCRWLLDGYSDAWLETPAAREFLTAEQIKNLREVQRYRDICRRLAPKHYSDAFHLWTGEVNGLTHFLSTDGTFRHEVMRFRELNLRCVPVLPTDLLSQLGVANRDPMPFEYGARYFLTGQRYD